MDKNYKPGHKLTAFAVIIACLYGLMALGATWTPRLGLDLKGGTTVTLTARADTTSAPVPVDTASPSASPTDQPSATPTAGNTNGAPSADAMQQALNIIQQRVNSLGVGDSSVQLQGNNQIQIAVPGVDSQELVNLVGKTAVLGFRNVYQVAQSTAPVPLPTATPSESPTDTATATPTAEPTDTTEPSASETVVAPTETPARRVAPALPTAPPTSRPTTAGSNPNTSFSDLLNWQPTAQDTADFTNWSCGMVVQDGKLPDGTPAANGTMYYPDGTPIVDVWDQPLFACDSYAQKYLLGPVIVQGQRVTGAQSGIPQGGVAYQVTLSFDSAGTNEFAQATAKLVNQTSPMNQFAIVLDGAVVSAPRVDSAIPGGQAQITGTFTQQQAQDLARVLNYGSLPLSFDASSVSTVSPTLGGEQLRAGILAGIIGLILTMLYAMFYYRGLAIIVIGSLISAAVITYSAIVLLGTTVGFALNLPGIAGVILAIGVTADSFIIFFERIRDEIRDGYSLTHSVESGWVKARGTIVVADAVQLLSAVVLFFLAIGDVRGFAFTLLVTTMIDLFIVFFFSKPLMTLLARRDYFRSGRPLSGFDAAHLGVTPEALRGRRASTGTVKPRATDKEA
ncbi:MAG: protein translocase subunit SecD [Propionibacteriaceae bacterium]|nr:protein translocase subunit SecD [Propionibacteriaceae bacterium]